jgi:hypothetical protein
MRTLLTMPLSEITFDDVESFCHPPDGPPENQVLEYKSGKGGEKVPSRDIAKAASALANTFGGMIILGVEDDQKGGHPENIPGVPADRDLEKEVSSILFDDITPPLVPLPEIRAVNLRDNPKKAVVVIRVAQSNATPHAIKNGRGNPCIYVRAGSESRPTEDWETSAGPEKLAWLFNRRRKSEELHDRLVHDALDRMDLLHQRGVFPHFLGEHRPSGQGKFLIVPLYPQGPVTTVQHLYDGCMGPFTERDLELRVVSQADLTEFPRYTLMRPSTTQDGVIGFNEDSETSLCSFEFNTSGLFLYQQTFAYASFDLPEPRWHLDFSALSQQLDSYLQVAARFYDRIDPVGLLQLNVTIENLAALCMVPPPNRMGASRYDPRHCVSYQRCIDCNRTIQTNELRNLDQKNEILLGLLFEIGSAFNWDQRCVRDVLGLPQTRNAQKGTPS